MYKHDNGIRLRKINQCDLPKLTHLKQESWFGTHKISIINEENQNKWYEYIISQDIHQPSILILIGEYESPTSEAIGVFKIANIDWVNRKADVGWDVFQEHRGKGLGRKIVKAGVDFSFNLLNLHRLDAEILENNIASQKCAEKAGFVKEGVKKDAILRNKKYINSIVYGCIG